MSFRAIIGLLVMASLVSPAGEAQGIATLGMLQKALALAPDTSHGQVLFLQYCAACHHRSGWGSGPREVPNLAGQQDAYLLEQLLQFEDLDRKKDEMHQVVTRPEVERPQAMRDVSAYIAAQPRNPHSDHGDGNQLPAGEQLYTQTCAICHGKNGEGNRDDLIPAIGGQQYGYLIVRLRYFAQQRGSVEHGSIQPAIVNLLARLSPAEVRAVADYTSRLPALQAR